MPKSLNQGKIFQSFSVIQEQIMWDKDLHPSLSTNQVHSPKGPNDLHYTNNAIWHMSVAPLFKGDRGGLRTMILKAFENLKSNLALKNITAS